LRWRPARQRWRPWRRGVHGAAEEATSVLIPPPARSCGQIRRRGPRARSGAPPSPSPAPLFNPPSRLWRRPNPRCPCSLRRASVPCGQRPWRVHGASASPVRGSCSGPCTRRRASLLLRGCLALPRHAMLHPPSSSLAALLSPPPSRWRGPARDVATAREAWRRPKGDAATSEARQGLAGDEPAGEVRRQRRAQATSGAE